MKEIKLASSELARYVFEYPLIKAIYIHNCPTRKLNSGREKEKTEAGRLNVALPLHINDSS